MTRSGGAVRRRAGGGRRAASWAFALLVPSGLLSCARGPAEQSSPLPLPVEVLADSGSGTRLAVRAPVIDPPDRAVLGDPAEAGASVWIARVTPAPPGGGGPPLPEPHTEIPEVTTAPPVLEIDPGLVPPILKNAAPLVVPEPWRSSHRGGPVTVEVDVLVEENGEVTEVEWASGSKDSLLVLAAARCADAMTFYPALKRGQPIAVWCRQRFDFAGR